VGDVRFVLADGLLEALGRREREKGRKESSELVVIKKADLTYKKC
jgi:hypothetical protein